MKYVATFYQSGGCDYTIGCGYRYQIFEASSDEAAFDKMQEHIEYYGEDIICGYSLHRIDATLTTAFDAYQNAIAEAHRAEEAKKYEQERLAQEKMQHQHDEAEFARLAAKLGKLPK